MNLPWWVAVPAGLLFIGTGIAFGVWLLRLFDVEGWLEGFGVDRPPAPLVWSVRLLVFLVGLTLGSIPLQVVRLFG